MELSTRARHAVRELASRRANWHSQDPSNFRELPPKALFAGITYDHATRVGGAGPKTIVEIIAWLAADGISMVGTPGPKATRPAQIKAAITLLRKNGYAVTPPN